MLPARQKSNSGKERESVMDTKWYWIQNWKEEDDKEPQFLYFRNELRVKELHKEICIDISADSKYKLYINGQFVEIGPSRGNREVWYYDTVNISKFLRKGINVIGVMILRYPEAHGQGNWGMFRTHTPGLYFRMNEEDGALSGWKYRKAESIRIVPENPYFAPLRIYENARGEGTALGWMNVEYDGSDWLDAAEYDEAYLTEILKPDRLLPRSIPFMYRIRREFLNFEKKVIPPFSKVEFDLDAGELMTGYLYLKMCGGKGAQIQLLQSECYAGDIEEKADPYNSLPVKGDRTDTSLHLYGHTDTYIVSGYGNDQNYESYEPFWFRTFRYIRVTVMTKDLPLTIEEIYYEETGYPLEITTRVETSDPTMNAVWDICERSLRRCMHESYEDCPFYEQLQYAMDARSQILYTYAVSADPRLAIKCMDDFSHSVMENGMINCSAPNYEINVIPGFSIYYIGMIYDYMMYYGEKNQIQKYMYVMKGILNYFKNHLDERGLVEKIGGLNRPGQYWSFIDWTSGWDATNGVPPCTLDGPITMESLLYILGLQYAADIYRYMGDDKQADEYERQASLAQEAVNHFCVGENGMYQDGPGIEAYSQHTQVFAVLTDTVSVPKGKNLLKETMEHSHKYEQCSIAMMFYLFRALEKCDLYSYTDKLWDIWRKMVEDHMTTCAEDLLLGRSDCHAWGALALYELPSVILGIRPAEPGYASVKKEPRCETLDWARGQVVTPKGMITAGWEKQL